MISGDRIPEVNLEESMHIHLPELLDNVPKRRPSPVLSLFVKLRPSVLEVAIS